MPESTTTFTYYDPSRCFDGTPYEAASKAVQQARLVARLLDRALEDADTQVRNAFMTRRLDTGQGDAGAIQYDEQAEARALTKARVELLALDRKLSAVQAAAAYDPKNPPEEAA